LLFKYDANSISLEMDARSSENVLVSSESMLSVSISPIEAAILENPDDRVEVLYSSLKELSLE